MSHTRKDKRTLLARVRRTEGQAEAIDGRTAERLDDHLRHHVVNPDDPDADRARGAAALIAVVETCRT